MRQKLKTIIIVVMAIFITLISAYSFLSVAEAIEKIRGSDLLWQCFAIWIKSIILTQAVLVVGGLFLFMIRKPKNV